MRPTLISSLAGVVLAVVAGVAGPATASPPGASCTGLVAVTHVTILPMTGAVDLTDQTVVTSKGRIARLGPSTRTPMPRGACVIDGRGRFLMPGLSDAHVHLFDAGDLALYLRFGVTSVLNMSGSHMHLRLREDLATGRIDGPTLYTTGPMVKIDASPLVEFEETPANLAEVAPMIGGYRSAGYDYVKIWGALTPDLYDALSRAAKAQNLKITGHIPRAVGLEGVLTAHQSIAHVEELLNKHFRTTPSVDQLNTTAARLASTRTTVTTTLVVYEAIAAANAADGKGLLSRPGVELMDPVRLAMWSPGANRLRGVARDPAATSQALTTMQAITLSLQKAGVRLLAGTDAGELPGLVPGLDLHRELALMVQAGMTPRDALQTATSNFGDEMSDKGDRFGVVEAGARADLLLLDRDPRRDIANVGAIHGVMTRGAYYDRAALDGLVSRLQHRNAQTAGYVTAFSQGGASGAATYIAAQQASGRTPTAMEPVLFMAMGLAQRGDLPSSEAMLKQIAGVFPEREEPWFIIAGLHRATGDNKGAIVALDEVIRRAPDHLRAMRDRSRLLGPTARAAR